MNIVYYAGLFGQGLGFCLIFILLIMIDCIRLLKGKNSNIYIIAVVLQSFSLYAQYRSYERGAKTAYDETVFWTYTISFIIVALVGYLITKKLKNKANRAQYKAHNKYIQDNSPENRAVSTESRKYCMRCGAQLEPTAKCCTECGLKVATIRKTNVDILEK